MKNVRLFLIVLFAGLATVSCNRSPRTTTTHEGTEGAMNENRSTALDAESEKFAHEAANGGLMEVDLGKIAQQNGFNKRVKNFGEMMVTDHQKINDELKQIASSMNIQLSDSVNSDTRRDIDKLRKKTGADFDKDYMKMMVDDHEKDIKKFEDIAKSSKDSTLKSFASKSLSILLKHLDSAKAISAVVKK